MQTMQAMRERRNALAKEIRNLMDKHPVANNSWGADQQKEYDDKMGEIERLEGAITREQKMLDLAAEKEFKELGGRDVDADGKGKLRALHKKWLRGGNNAITQEEWAAIRNTMSTTTGSEGGYAVQTDIAKELIDSLKAYGGMRLVADIFATEQGNPLSYPTSDGTAETGEVIAENTTATGADIVFGTKALNTFKFSSKIVAVPFELLQDSAIDVEGLVNKRLRQRLGRITNTKYTVGSGTGEPQGVSGVATAGKVGTTGQTLTVIYDDIVDLQEAVDDAYQQAGNCVFMMAQSSRKVVRKIKDGQSRPIFNPGFEVGTPKGTPDELLGRPLIINGDVAAMAANAKSILYGDFNYYKIRDAMQVTLFRFTDSAYAKLGQVGFLAWMRSGGNLMDTSAVKYYQNSAT